MILTRLTCLATILTAGFFTGPASAMDGVAGPYLAAQAATSLNDYKAASGFFNDALLHDPTDPALMESSVISDIALGNVAGAVPIAKALDATGTKSQVARTVILADTLNRGAYDDAIKAVADGQGVGPLVDGLVTAWSQVGAGKMSDALASFDKLADNPGLKAFALYHKALAMASVGDFEGAAKIFGGTDIQPTRTSLVAYIEVLSQLDRDKDALALLNEKFGIAADPGIEPLRQRLQAGEVVPFDVVRNAKDGLSEVFYSVAAALKGEASDGFTLVYSRIAQFLRPDNSEAILLTAGLLDSQGQHDLAIEAYGAIARTDPAYFTAQQGRAQALYSAGQYDAGIEAMKQLVAAHPDLLEAQASLADLLRRQERYAEALPVYDAAIALLKDPKPRNWAIFYMRGVCNERTGHWDKAEADLREALTLRPDEPEVLNYLGYAMIERNEKLDDALAMIKRAVAARPDDGYIVDSLSWGYYRTGHYAEAVPIAERASQLMPVDAVVTDHLGDIYWSVGRKLEAQFQWHRALSFNPDPKDEVRIKRKLEIGLDAVLKEEGAPPLKTTSAAGSANGG